MYRHINGVTSVVYYRHKFSEGEKIERNIYQWMQMRAFAANCEHSACFPTKQHN